MDKNLLKRRNDISKVNRMDEWTLSIVGGLTLACLMLIGVLSHTSLFLLIVPFLVLPLFYSFHIMHTGFSAGKRLTFSNSLKFFSLYFKKPNSSSFSFISTLGRTLLVFFISNFFITVITGVVFYNIYPDLFDLVISEFLSGAVTGNFDGVYLLISENLEIYTTFTLIIELSSFCIASFVFLHYMSFNSLSIYLRLYMRGSPVSFINSVFKYTVKKNKKQITKDYFLLLWPFYVLFFIGVLGSIPLLLLYTTNVNFIVIVALACGVLLSCLFFPLYFSSKEAIFEKYQLAFQTNSFVVAEELLNRIQAKINISEEESDEIRNTINNIKNQKEQESSDKEDKTDDLSS